MSNLLKKTVLAFLSSLLIFLSVAPYFSVVKAVSTDPGGSGASSNSQGSSNSTGTWYNSNFGDWWNKVYDQNNPSEIFGERYTAAQVQWVIYSLFAFVLNSSVNASTLSCLLSNADKLSNCSGAIEQLIKGSASADQPTIAQKTQNLWSLVLADKPISGVTYLKNKIANFSFIPVVHAQSVGVGFSALSLVQNLWKSFRDIAFGLFVLAAIIFAFMIMFRVKINPQTVITVQSAIPKLIIALVLVTFSYALAGFMIDIMYIVIGLVSLLLAPLIPTVPILQTAQYKAADLFNLLTVGPTIGSGAAAYSGGILGLLGLYLGPLILLFAAIMIIGFIVSGPFFGIVGWIGLVLLIIFIIIDLWIAIKTVWGLFKAFANILLLTIFAPVQIVAGTIIPNFGFGQWLRSYFSNLSVFIVTGVLFTLAWIFSLNAWVLSGGVNITLSGSTASPWPPLLGTGGKGWVGLLFIGVSFVLFTMIPKATELVQAFLSGKPFAYGSAIGEAFGPFNAAWGFYGAPRLRGLQEETGRKFANKDIQNIITWFNDHGIGKSQDTNTGKAKTKR